MANTDLNMETSNRVLLGGAVGFGCLVLFFLLSMLFPVGGWAFWALLGCPLAVALAVDRMYVKHLRKKPLEGS